jgi:hypothetical protein
MNSETGVADTETKVEGSLRKKARVGARDARGGDAGTGVGMTEAVVGAEAEVGTRVRSQRVVAARA